MKLFVANCTKMAQDFRWRPRNHQRGQPPVLTRIEAGQQVQMPGDWISADISHLHQQHARFGFVDAKDVDRSKGVFIGMCFSVDKPVDIAAMQTALVQNDEILQARGAELRQRAALAAEHVATQGAPGSGLVSLETTVLEVTRGGAEPSINETIRVERGSGPGPGSPQPAQRSTRGGRRAA